MYSSVENSRFKSLRALPFLSMPNHWKTSSKSMSRASGSWWRYSPISPRRSRRRSCQRYPCRKKRLRRRTMIRCCLQRRRKAKMLHLRMRRNRRQAALWMCRRHRSQPQRHNKAWQIKRGRTAVRPFVVPVAPCVIHCAQRRIVCNAYARLCCVC